MKKVMKALEEMIDKVLRFTPKAKKGKLLKSKMDISKNKNWNRNN